jgi:hypothetical protein
MRIILSILLLSICFAENSPCYPWCTKWTCGPGTTGPGATWSPGYGLCLNDCSDPTQNIYLDSNAVYESSWWEWSEYNDECAAGILKCCFYSGDGVINNQEECDLGSTLGSETYLANDNSCPGNCFINEAGVGTCDPLALGELIIPYNYNISSIHPNPFNPATTISFSIPEFGLTTITAYNINGRKLETLSNKVLSMGNYSINWNASSYPSGVYLIRMESGEFTQTQKVVLVK